MWTQPGSIASILVEHHYLGPIKRGLAWRDEYGVIVVSSPTSRRLPGNWLELSRWCITLREHNAGSQQWAAFVRALRTARPDVSTIVSYSDPSVGHTGALYRACNWLWAPTWHRLRPPPSGNGAWSSRPAQSVKDRWVFILGPDPARQTILKAKDQSILNRLPWAEYTEPKGADYKQWREHSQTPGDSP